MKLTAHYNKQGKFSEIDRFILIPKKIWEDFSPGISDYKINDRKFTLRVYDVPCDCTGNMHTHRLIDLRDIWDDLGIEDGQILEISR